MFGEGTYRSIFISAFIGPFNNLADLSIRRGGRGGFLGKPAMLLFALCLGGWVVIVATVVVATIVATYRATVCLSSGLQCFSEDKRWWLGSGPRDVVRRSID